MIRQIKVTQVLRVEREAFVDVDCESHEDGIGIVADGEIDIPQTGWTVTRESVMSEEYEEPRLQRRPANHAGHR